MSFGITHQNLGKVKSGRKYEIRFPYDDTVTSITNINLSCGCSGAAHYPVNRELVVTYKPGEVPYHLKGQGYYYARNQVVVDITLTDGSKFPMALTFEATVY